MVTSRIHAKRAGKKPQHLYIEEWMNRKGVSDETLAGRLEVSRETVTRYRNEQNRLRPDKIAAIAHHLQLKVTDLWSPPPPLEEPPRPSLDDLVKDVPTEEVRKLADFLEYKLKTGTK